MKQVYMPVTESDTAVIGLRNNGDWPTIKKALGRSALSTWTPPEVFVARNGRFLFNVKENREDMFCSSEFKLLVEENRLSNLRFVPVPMRRKLIGRQ